MPFWASIFKNKKRTRKGNLKKKKKKVVVAPTTPRPKWGG
jgi:hypothetical protein